MNICINFILFLHCICTDAIAINVAQCNKFQSQLMLNIWYRRPISAITYLFYMFINICVLKTLLFSVYLCLCLYMYVVGRNAAFKHEKAVQLRNLWSLIILNCWVIQHLKSRMVKNNTNNKQEKLRCDERAAIASTWIKYYIIECWIAKKKSCICKGNRKFYPRLRNIYKIKDNKEFTKNALSTYTINDYSIFMLFSHNLVENGVTFFKTEYIRWTFFGILTVLHSASLKHGFFFAVGVQKWQIA